MTKKELVYMIRDYKDAIKLVKNHLELNPVSSDVPMWVNAIT